MMEEAAQAGKFWKRLLRWEKRFNFSDILITNNIKSVAIYGAGRIGLFLAKCLLTQNVVEVRGIIDMNRDVALPFSIPLLHPDELPENLGVDAIIVSVFSLIRNYAYKYYLRSKTNCEVIGLDEVVIDPILYDGVVEALRHVQESGGRSLLLSLYRGYLWRIKNPSAYEIGLRTHQALRSRYETLDQLMPALSFLYSDIEYCDEEFLRDMIKIPSVVNVGGVHLLQDMNNKCYNVVGHSRVTSDAPLNFDSRVMVFGNCVAVGGWSPDDRTIASHLQRLLNNRSIDDRVYAVRNCANWTGVFQTAIQICSTAISPGDWVLFISSFWGALSRLYVHTHPLFHWHVLSSALDRPHDMGEIYIDYNHFNHRGYKLLADRIFNILCDSVANGHATKHEPHLQKNRARSAFLLPGGSTPEIPDGLGIFLKNLDEKKRPPNESIGAIVMNCDPFTKGHRYLVEKGLELCDHLFIFVVQEDRGVFRFSDRFEMVRLGTADLERVTVIPSGAFVISNETLPEYFTKHMMKDVTVDASKDLMYFGAHICPTLNIKKRIVGNEPNCPITRQYNQAMQETLPEYGIEVHVFERMRHGAEPISASRVRAGWNSGAIDDIRDFVPETTFKYLNGLPKSETAKKLGQ